MVFVPVSPEEEEENRQQAAAAAGETGLIPGSGVSIPQGGGALGSEIVGGAGTLPAAGAPNLAALAAGGREASRGLAGRFAQDIIDRGIAAQGQIAGGLERFGEATEEATFRQDPGLLSGALAAPTEFLQGDPSEVQRLLDLRDAQFGGLSELSQRQDFGGITRALSESGRDITDLRARAGEFLGQQGVGIAGRDPSRALLGGGESRGIIQSAQRAVESLGLQGRLEAAGQTSRGLAEAGRATTEATRLATAGGLTEGIGQFQTDIEAGTEQARQQALDRLSSARGLFRGLGGSRELAEGERVFLRPGEQARGDLGRANVPENAAQAVTAVAGLQDQIGPLEQQVQADSVAAQRGLQSPGAGDRAEQLAQLQTQLSQNESQVQAAAGAIPVSNIEATDQQLSDLGITREQFGEIAAPAILENFKRVANFYGQADAATSESVNIAFQAVLGDASRFVSEIPGALDQITPQTFATPKQFAQFEALKFLASDEGNAFLTDVSVAGTADLDITQLDRQALEDARLSGLDEVSLRALQDALARTSSGRRSKKRRRRKRLARFLGGGFGFGGEELDPTLGTVPQGIFTDAQGRGIGPADVPIPSGGVFSSGVGKFLGSALTKIPQLGAIAQINPFTRGFIKSEGEKLLRPETGGQLVGTAAPLQDIAGAAAPAATAIGGESELDKLLARINELRQQRAGA